MFKLTIILVSLICIQGFRMPTVPLRNAAQKDTNMPVMGLGIGGYASCTKDTDCSKVPACWWSECCFDTAYNAILDWFKAGGRRIDSANSYYNQPSFAKALKDSNLTREEIWITEKVGPSLPLGYNDTLMQLNDTLKTLNVEYVDLLLVHWPIFHNDPHNNTLLFENAQNSTDPFCINGTAEFNVYKCIGSTWKAMEQIFKEGKARAIGVSNHNITHLGYILEHGELKPSVSQDPYNPYLVDIQHELVEFCHKHGIHYQGYSPLGVPDYHDYVSPMATKIINDTVVDEIAQKHNKTSAQVLLNWSIFHREISVNPRARAVEHHTENLDIFVNEFRLDQEDVKKLDSRPQDYCNYYDKPWYECNGTNENPGNQFSVENMIDL